MALYSLKSAENIILKNVKRNPYLRYHNVHVSLKVGRLYGPLDVGRPAGLSTAQRHLPGPFEHPFTPRPRLHALECLPDPCL